MQKRKEKGPNQRCNSDEAISQTDLKGKTMYQDTSLMEGVFKELSEYPKSLEVSLEHFPTKPKRNEALWFIDAMTPAGDILNPGTPIPEEVQKHFIGSRVGDLCLDNNTGIRYRLLGHYLVRSIRRGTVSLENLSRYPCQEFDWCIGHYSTESESPRKPFHRTTTSKPLKGLHVEGYKAGDAELAWKFHVSLRSDGQHEELSQLITDLETALDYLRKLPQE